jgi:hypothetical protein
MNTVTGTTIIGLLTPIILFITYALCSQIHHLSDQKKYGDKSDVERIMNYKLDVQQGLRKDYRSIMFQHYKCKQRTVEKWKLRETHDNESHLEIKLVNDGKMRYGEYGEQRMLGCYLPKNTVSVFPIIGLSPQFMRFTNMDENSFLEILYHVLEHETIHYALDKNISRESCTLFDGRNHDYKIANFTCQLEMTGFLIMARAKRN